MTSNNLPKLNILMIMVIVKLANATTNYLSDNIVTPREAPQPNHHSQIPQQYYLPYQKYVATSDKYVVPRPEGPIPVAVTTTEKALFSPTYKVTLDNSKYITSQVAKTVQGNQVSYPYLFTLAKAVPTTAATYTSPPTVGNDYNDYSKEIPKKYHYGYRVSNPHTGTEFGHSEVNDGLTAKGYYHVLLPDGRLQNVKYWAGPSGYHATITYETQY